MKTWLCTFEVKADLPETLSVTQMEAAVAHAIATYFHAEGYPTNCSVTLRATAGNASVANPTEAIPLKAPAASTATKVPGGTL